MYCGELVVFEDVARLNLEYAIFHRIFPPTGPNGRIPPQISNQIIRFDESNTKECLFLKSEITKVLNHDAVGITMDHRIPSPTPSLINDIFTKMDDHDTLEKIKTESFVNDSISMAHQLDFKQDRRSTSGVLVILYGKIDAKHVLIIAKLEEGRDLQIQELKEGEVLSLGIDIVEHIIRLQKATVLKVGIFFRDPKTGDDEPENIGFLCDTQNTEHKGADYYIKDFLGCEYTNDSKKQTETFYDVTTEFIGNTFDLPVEQVEKREQLSSFLLSESSVIVPRNFVETFIPVKKRQALEDLYKSRNIEYNGFSKDTNHIRNKVEKMKILFENGISITGASANFASEVTIDRSDSSGTTFTVNSKISKIPMKITKKRTEKSNADESTESDSQ
jgi:hypothetical protein